MGTYDQPYDSQLELLGESLNFSEEDIASLLAMDPPQQVRA